MANTFPNPKSYGLIQNLFQDIFLGRWFVKNVTDGTSPPSKAGLFPYCAAHKKFRHPKLAQLVFWKMLLDSVRMAACRAETAMTSTAREFLSAPDTIRGRIRALTRIPSDIMPNESVNVKSFLVLPSDNRYKEFHMKLL